MASLLNEMWLHGARDFWCISFDHAAIERLHELDEALPLGYLYRSDVTEFAPSTDAVRAVCPHFSTVARYPEQVERAHQLGKRVFTWTVNEETEMRRMAELGVDGIVSDRPSVLLSVLGEETL